jgi:hypothetical protein
MSVPLYPTILKQSALAELTAMFLKSLPPSANNTGKIWSVAQWNSVKTNISEQTAEITPEANSDALASARGTFSTEISGLEQDFVTSAISLAAIANTFPDGAVISNQVPAMLDTLALSLGQIGRGVEAAASIDLYSEQVAAYNQSDNLGLWSSFAGEQAGLQTYQNRNRR